MATAIAIAAAPGPAAAVLTNFHYHKWVVSGGNEVLGTSSELDLDCRVVKLTPPIVTSAPEHGKLVFLRTIDFPKFNIDNPHYKCSFKKVPGLRIVYRSSSGFRGTDHFTFQETAINGDVNISTFDMTVQ